MRSLSNVALILVMSSVLANADAYEFSGSNPAKWVARGINANVAAATGVPLRAPVPRQVTAPEPDSILLLITMLAGLVGVLKFWKLKPE